MSGPFKMKGSSLYGYGNSSPAKDRETWSVESHRDEAAAHNTQEATSGHHGTPHGPDPTPRPPKMNPKEQKAHNADKKKSALTKKTEVKKTEVKKKAKADKPKKEELNQWGETNAEYIKRVGEMGLRNAKPENN